MSEFMETPKKPLSLNDEGHHPCSNCGEVWFETRVVFGERFPVAVSMEATCQSCGFPLMLEADDER